MTDMEAIPPIRPMTTPSRTVVLRNVAPSRTPILASGQREVREIEVALRKEDVTRTIMTIVKTMKRLKPVSAESRRATSAMDFPPSRMVMKRVEKSWTAPIKIPPRMIHSQAGTKP